jgi:hypothetical protein
MPADFGLALGGKSEKNAPILFGIDYRFFFVRRLFLWVGAAGTSEKVDDVRIAGSIGATLVVVLTLILPAGVSVVLVRIRMGNFSSIRSHVPPREPTPGWISLNGKGRNLTLLTTTPPLATRNSFYELVDGAAQRWAYVFSEPPSNERDVAGLRESSSGLLPTHRRRSLCWRFTEPRDSYTRGG